MPHDDMSDRELLIRLDVKMDTALERLNNHGTRIRALEQWRWVTGGGLAAVGIFVGWLKLKIKINQ